MPKQSIYYVGSVEEVSHHAEPLQRKMPINLAAPEETLRLAQPGDLAIFSSEHFDRCRDACRQLKQRRCATLYAIDGILEWRNAWENRADEPACPWTMRPVLSHKVACIGQSQTRVLDAWGNINKTETVGLPRLDAIQPTQRRTDGEFRVLVMTAKTPGFTEQQVENTRRALSDLKNWFEQHPVVAGRRIQPVWRLTGGLDRSIDVTNQASDLSGGELRAVLKNVDAVITTPSTSILESMLCGLPVASLEYNPCPSYLPTAWEISAACQIDFVVRELIDRPAVKMLWQQTLLHDHLECEYGAADNAAGKRSATDRMCELIDRMMVTARQSVGAGLELAFPAKMLATSRAETLLLPEQSFNLQQLFPGHESFANFDMMELQAELAHARREIEYRQSLLDQAKSELAEAHAILFSIEKHPIAGPIVKARRKMLDWLGSWKKNKAKTERVAARDCSQ